ncbi:MAG TPA: tetrahydrofolate dehydrogenase/cyclohydrolase catalytic domain-containing protein [Longimicrobiales bacterium]|nr:tetrahydrofolate dehydrogenase/cyclohydrolase catalytic domain-containing protein [Longimicrobiales bacterium]
MAALILDGAGLARRRQRMIAERAAAVRARRGYAPSFILVAFGDEQGHARHVSRKQRMGVEAGVDLTPLIVAPRAQTGDAIVRLRRLMAARPFDGIFLQFPFPDTIDGDALADVVPVELDVDIMTPVRTARYTNGTEDLPPVTVSAALLLLEEYDVSIEGRRGIVVADDHPFSRMLHAAFARRGADMRDLVDPAAPDLDEHVRAAELVVVSAAMPGLVSSTNIAPGAVAIDVGYFNPGGCGDIDLSGGIDHLAALCPVPGGIGPMTISALLERVVLFAETAGS